MKTKVLLAGLLLIGTCFSALAQHSNLGCFPSHPERLEALSLADRQALYDLYAYLQGDNAVKLGEYVRRPDLLQGSLFAHDALKQCDLPIALIRTVPFTPIYSKLGIAKSAGKIIYALMSKPKSHQSLCVLAAKSQYQGCLSGQIQY